VEPFQEVNFRYQIKKKKVGGKDLCAKGRPGSANDDRVERGGPGGGKGVQLREIGEYWSEENTFILTPHGTLSECRHRGGGNGAREEG